MCNHLEFIGLDEIQDISDDCHDENKRKEERDQMHMPLKEQTIRIIHYKCLRK